MDFDLKTVVLAAIIGIGGTLALDVWAALLQRIFHIPATNWAMVGRWIAHMRDGRFVHENIGAAAPVRDELAIGWAFHYAVGIAYGWLLIALLGSGWLQQPTLLAPIAVALALLIAPYFFMMPGLGFGIAGSRTPKPNVTRLKSALAHTAFGFGMYATAWAINVLSK